MKVHECTYNTLIQYSEYVLSHYYRFAQTDFATNCQHYMYAVNINMEILGREH